MPFASCSTSSTGRFASVCGSISSGNGEEDVYKITILSDKHDLTHMPRPWAASWLVEIAERSRKTFTRRIWIAWELGDYKLFAAECHYLCLNTSIDADGNLVDSAGVRLDRCPMLENLDILGDSPPPLGSVAFLAFASVHILHLR